MKYTFKIFVIIGAYFLLAGCTTSKKVDGWIADNQISPTKLKTSDYITLNPGKEKNSDTISVTKKGKFKLIPAIVYWRTESSFVSTLNQWVPLNIFNAGVIKNANAVKLKQKLNGQKIELSVDKFPATFALTNISHLIYFGVYYINWSKNFEKPEKQNLAVTYRILKDNIETKRGIINVTDNSVPQNLKLFQSYKKLTINYLEKYDTNIQAMSKQFVDKLLAEL